MATRSDLRSLARIRADQDSSTFPTDAQYNTLLDFAGKAVWFDLIGAGWPVSFSSVDKTATGTNPITLGVGTVAFIRGVYRKDGATYTELRRLNEGDRASLMSSSGEATHYNILHDATNGAVLELFPVPSSGTYRVEYITEWSGFANDAATWPGPARSDELVALKAAIMGMRKEGNDQGAVMLEREYAALFESVLNMASHFNMKDSAMIRDVMGGGLTVPRRAFDYDID